MSQIKGLCVMDVDGTLILEEVIDLLGREVGREDEISQITSRVRRGELDFEAFLSLYLIKLSTLFIYHQMHRNLFLFSKRMAS